MKKRTRDDGGRWKKKKKKRRENREGKRKRKKNNPVRKLTSHDTQDGDECRLKKPPQLRDIRSWRSYRRDSDATQLATASTASSPSHNLHAARRRFDVAVLACLEVNTAVRRSSLEALWNQSQRRKVELGILR